MLEEDLVDLSFGGDDDDLVFTDDIEFTSGTDSVLQLCMERMGTIRGEWFLDENEGMPWMESDSTTSSQAILGGRYDEQKVRDSVSLVLLTTPGVAKIDSIVVTFDSTEREVTVKFTVTTVFGVTTTGTVVI